MTGRGVADIKTAGRSLSSDRMYCRSRLKSGDLVYVQHIDEGAQTCQGKGNCSSVSACSPRDRYALSLKT
jgi:hypothetical protein